MELLRDKAVGHIAGGPAYAEAYNQLVANVKLCKYVLCAF